MLALVETRALDRERGAGGDRLEQRHLVVAESSRLDRRQVEDADDAFARQQRHADERAGGTLERRQRVRIGCDVVHDDGPSCGGDPAGDALADRNGQVVQV